MRTIILNTRNKAVAKAKDVLKSENNVKRLAYSTIKNTSCQCACGETQAVEVTAQIKGQWFYQTVGICENCGDKS